MFYESTELSSLDISKLNTKNVLDMSYMFYSCEYLNILELSNFDTNQLKICLECLGTFK